MFYDRIAYLVCVGGFSKEFQALIWNFRNQIFLVSVIWFFLLRVRDEGGQSGISCSQDWARARVGYSCLGRVGLVIAFARLARVCEG